MDIYDIIIVGAGPAGFNAAIYSVRKGAKTLLIGEQPGGQMMITSGIENFIGFPNVSGTDLASAFKEHAQKVGVESLPYKKVVKIEKEDKHFNVFMEDETKIKGKCVIITTGAKPRTLKVSGENRFVSRGLSYCAICDGPFYSGMDVIICGGGNSAVESAIDLARIAKKVTIVHRSEFRADKVLLDELKKLQNVEIHIQTQVLKILGRQKLEGMLVLDKNENKEFEIKADGVFVEIGHEPDTSWLKNLVELNERGEIIVDKMQKTSTDGVFAAGDVTDTPYKQIVIAVGEGAKAALSANAYLQTV